MDTPNNRAKLVWERVVLSRIAVRPLIVLTATRQDDTSPEIRRKDAQADEDLWVHQLQPELARLSTHGKQIVVDSSHEMPTEHPEVVVSAIHEVWLAVHHSPPQRENAMGSQTGSGPMSRHMDQA